MSATTVLRTEVARLTQEAVRLRKALEPFVDAYNKGADHIADSDLYPEQPRSVHVTLGDCRKAARVLRR